jgi:hypothetical protein
MQQQVRRNMSQGNRLPIIVGAAVVLAVVAATFLLRGTGREPAASGDATAAAAAETTDARVPADAPAVRRPAVAPTQGADVDEAVIGHVERRAQMREEQQARTEALREQSSQRYASEQVDPAWAPGKISELNAVAADPSFAEAGATPRNLSVDCRSSMCRLEGDFADAGQAEDWIMLYNASVGGAMPSSVVSRTRNPDGSMRVEIYGRAR